MKKIFFLIIVLHSTIVNSQCSKISMINFEYNCSVILFSEVKICIVESYEKKEKYIVTAWYYKDRKKIVKRSEIDSETFNNIVNHIVVINNSDLIKGFTCGLDGETIEISISSDFSNTISYKIWSLSENNLYHKDFYLATSLILKSAKLKFSELK